MKFLTNLIQKFFPPFEPIKPGIYTYTVPDELVDFPYRMQLRIESNGEGILILNASTVLHLNQTATEFLFHFMRGLNKKEIINLMRLRYQAEAQTLEDDYNDLSSRLMTMLNQPDLDPVTFLDFDRETPYSTDLSAPYRMDIALTYQTDDGDLAAAPHNRVEKELDTNEWLAILDKTWAAGVPHVVFTGGEPTRRDDLPELIAHTEEIGQVSGLLTNGIRLADSEYLGSLLQAGLDHLMIVFNPLEPRCWDAINRVMPEDLHTTIHLTIRDDQLHTYQLIMEKLREHEVDSLSLSASDPAFNETLQMANETALNLGFNLVWDLPVPYSNLNPVSLELNHIDAPMHVRAEGLAWLYLEPDGDVLAAQGHPEVIGNLLEQDWETVWAACKANHPSTETQEPLPA